MPGKKLNLTALLYAKKFRYHGYKTGALTAFAELELAGLGALDTKKTKSGKVRIVTDILPLLLSQTSSILLVATYLRKGRSATCPRRKKGFCQEAYEVRCILGRILTGSSARGNTVSVI